MRLPLFPLPFIASIFFTILLAAPTAHATGNVLLPSSGNDTSSTPNLGIAPPAAPVTTQPATTANATTETQTSAPAYTFAPTPTASRAPQTVAPTFNMNDFISPIDEKSAKDLPPGAAPTRVIHQPDNSAALAQATANLPYALTISIGVRSVFGSEDVATISDKLGLTRDQIASSCYLSVSGLVQTDKTSVIVDGGLSPKITVHYDGMIQGAMLAGEALCTAGKLPPGSGFINQLGNRYIVALQAINCVAPTRQVTQMIINYDGTDNSSCSYQ